MKQKILWILAHLDFIWVGLVLATIASCLIDRALK